MKYMYQPKCQLFSSCSENKFIVCPGCHSQSIGGVKSERKHLFHQKQETGVRNCGKSKVKPSCSSTSVFLSECSVYSVISLLKYNATDFCPYVYFHRADWDVNLCLKDFHSNPKIKENSNVIEGGRGTSTINQFTLQAAHNLSPISSGRLTPPMVYFLQRMSEKWVFFDREPSSVFFSRKSDGCLPDSQWSASLHAL